MSIQTTENFPGLQLPEGSTITEESEVLDSEGKIIGILVPEKWYSGMPSTVPKLFIGKDEGFVRWHNRYTHTQTP